LYKHMGGMYITVTSVWRPGHMMAVNASSVEPTNSDLVAWNCQVPTVHISSSPTQNHLPTCRQHTFDVVMCFEERVAEAVMADLEARSSTGCRPVLVINLDVKDSHEEAAKVSCAELCRALPALWPVMLAVMLTLLLCTDGLCRAACDDGRML
jgi:hypothetical protein